MNAPVQVPYNEVICPLDGAVIVGGRFANVPAKESMLRTMAAVRGPATGAVLHAARGRFHGLHLVVQQALQTALVGLGLVEVAIAERGFGQVVLLGELAHVDLGALARQVGARIEALDEVPGAGSWFCNSVCLRAFVKRELRDDRSFVSGDDPRAVREAEKLERARQASGRIDAGGPSGDLRLSCANACGGSILIPRSFDFERASIFVQTSGGSIEQVEGGAWRYLCGVRCRVEAARSAERRGPPPKEVTREDMIARYGRHHVPESRAAAVYRDVHGHDPGEEPPPAGADQSMREGPGFARSDAAPEPARPTRSAARRASK